MKKYITKYEWRWASIITILSLLWTAFEFEMGWHSHDIDSHKYFTFFFLFFLTLGYYLFFLDKRGNRFKKRFKFRHAFYSGLGLTVLIALFSIPTQLFVHYFVTPDYLINAKDYAITSGELTSQQAGKVFKLTNFVLFFPIVYILYGILISAVFASLLQRSNRKK
ncbi:MAG: DUF4199 domain-containing protein [Flavobacteriaceae bacterium]|nr:DUF4199 domain-containing protein [Flavobacteriaceae bacterium]